MLLKEKVQKAHDMLKDNIGKKYALYIDGLTSIEPDMFIGEEFIEGVSFDYEYNLLTVNLKGGSVERFSLPAIKDVKLNKNSIQFIYNDDSYAKIFLE